MRRFLTAILFLFTCSSAQAGEGWDHSIGIYGWFTGLEGTIGVADVFEQPVDATFSDLSNYLDFAMAGRYEAQSTTMVWMADVAYTSLGAERDAQVANQPVKVGMDLKQWIVEGGGGWRVSPEFTVLLVGRYYNIDTGATFTIEGHDGGNSVSKGWADIYVGGRWAKRLGTKWTVSLRGDIGFGGSDFAWFGQAMIGYDLSSKFTLAGGWRGLGLDHEADIDSADYFKYDVTQSGLGLALAYRF